MRARSSTVAVASCLVAGSLATVRAAAPEVMHPAAAEIQGVQVGNQWTRWEGLADLEGALGYRERVTALHAAPDGAIWVGTSRGRLSRYLNNAWTREATLDQVQITGIALGEKELLWLSTSDGLARLRRPEKEAEGAPGDWLVDRYRHYYQGHPAFVSGAYIPGEDATRRWGYVDNVFVPRQIAGYAPYAISTEHGLFCWGSYHGVWHHFLPHFWGANSDWLDTRELFKK